MKAWLRPRNGILANGLASLLLIAGFAWVAWSLVPRAGVANVTQRFDAPSAESLSTKPQELPVFIMRSNHSVVRNGTATREPDGGIGVSLFATTVDERPSATEALLFEPGFALLWVAAADASRDELRHRLDLVQDRAAQTIEDVITSRKFNETYRPILRAILTDAISKTWADARTGAAVEDLMASADVAFRRDLRGAVETIVMSRVREAVWEMLQANWLNTLGVPFGYEIDYTPALNAVSAVLADPRMQQELSDFASDRLGTAEARRVAERIVIGSSDALMRDRRVPKIISEMMADRSLREMIAPLSDSFVSFFAALPRHLGGLGSESSLNPLAAQVFKGMALGQRTPLILFVTPDERVAIQRLNPDAATLLQPSGMAART